MKIHCIFFLLSLAFTKSFSNPNPCLKNEGSCTNNTENLESRREIVDNNNNLRNIEDNKISNFQTPQSCEEAANLFSECNIKKYLSADDLCLNGYNKCINIINLYKELCQVESNVTKDLEVLLKSKCELDSSGQLCPFSQNLLDIEFGMNNKIDFSVETIDSNCYDQKCRNIVLDFLMLCKTNYFNNNNNNYLNIYLNMIDKNQIDYLISYINSSKCKKQVNMLQKILDKINHKNKRKIEKKETLDNIEKTNHLKGKCEVNNEEKKKENKLKKRRDYGDVPLGMKNIMKNYKAKNSKNGGNLGIGKNSKENDIIDYNNDNLGYNRQNTYYTNKEPIDDLAMIRNKVNTNKEPIDDLAMIRNKGNTNKEPIDDLGMFRNKGNNNKEPIDDLGMFRNKGNNNKEPIDDLAMIKNKVNTNKEPIDDLGMFRNNGNTNKEPIDDLAMFKNKGNYNK
jgi:hypothetical protein